VNIVQLEIRRVPKLDQFSRHLAADLDPIGKIQERQTPNPLAAGIILVPGANFVEIVEVVLSETFAVIRNGDLVEDIAHLVAIQSGLTVKP
jgi:hypothetical protein